MAGSGAGQDWMDKLKTAKKLLEKVDPKIAGKAAEHSAKSLGMGAAQAHDLASKVQQGVAGYQSHGKR